MKPDIENCKIGKIGPIFISAIKRTSVLSATNSQRFSNLFHKEFTIKENLCYLHFLTLNYVRHFNKWNNRTVCEIKNFTIIIFVYRSDFTAFEKFLINREVPHLFKCNLLLLKQVLSMLLLFIKLISLPLHKLSNFLLVSLILSSKSWSLRWILDNPIFMLSSVSYSLID